MPPTTAPARLGELRFKQETAHGEAIATPSTYWNTSPKKLRVFDVNPAGLKRLSEQDPALQTRLLADPGNLLLGKRQELSFRCFLAGLNQVAVDGQAVGPQDDLGLLLKTALGGEQLGTTTTVAAASGPGFTTPLKVSSAAGLSVGGALMVSGEARRITAVSGTDITLDMDLSSSPAQGTLVKAAATYYPVESALVDLNDANHKTLAALLRGYHSEDQWQVRGAAVELELADLGANKLAKLAVTLKGLDWELVTGVAVGTIPTEANPTAQVNSGLYMNTQGTGTRNFIHTKNVDVKLGLTRQALESPAGQQGIAGHIVTEGRTMLEFETFYDSEWDVAYQALTKKLAGYQIGTSVLLSFPQLTIDETPERGAGPEASVKVKMHADEGPLTSSDLARARFAIHRFPQ